MLWRLMLQPPYVVHNGMCCEIEVEVGVTTQMIVSFIAII
jgi:hypothetical protein